MWIFGIEEALITSAWRALSRRIGIDRVRRVDDVFNGGQKDALDDVDYAIILDGNVLLVEFNVGILPIGIVQLGNLLGLLLDFNVEALTVGGEGSLPAQILDGHPPVGGMIHEDRHEDLSEGRLVEARQEEEGGHVELEDGIGVGRIAASLVPQIVRGRPAEGLIVGREQCVIFEEAVDLLLQFCRLDQLQEDAKSLVRTGLVGQMFEELVGGEIVVLAIDPALVEAR
mmetsp:Transcript_25638/g.74179  ORF Transcript_25638/g.74179 Transcript_25638/m.74179 type:complete len:228 (+) Transcript_25638:1201-1884(+)